MIRHRKHKYTPYIISDVTAAFPYTLWYIVLFVRQHGDTTALCSWTHLTRAGWALRSCIKWCYAHMETLNTNETTNSILNLQAGHHWQCCQIYPCTSHSAKSS
jgi:hypothetical protein